MGKEQEKISSLKAILKGAGVFFTGLIISKIFNLIYNIIIARFYGAKIFGFFALGLAVFEIMRLFATLGVPTGVTRYISYYLPKKDEKKIRGTIVSGMQMVMSASIILSILVYMSAPVIAQKVFHSPEVTQVIRILCLAVPFFAVGSIIGSCFLSFKKVEYYIFSEHIVQHAFKIIFLIIFAALGYGIIGITMSWVAGIIISALFSFYLLNKKIYPIKEPKDYILIHKELAKFSFPLVLGGAMSYIINWTDTLMLGYFMKPSDVGVYRVTAITSRTILIFSSALLTLFLPIITELVSMDMFKEMERTYKIINKWIISVNISFFIVILLFSKQILNVLYGKNFICGYKALMVLSTGFLFLSLNNCGRQVLIAIKKTGYTTFNTITSGVLNVMLNIILIPVYGILGAAIASAISIFIEFILLFIELWIFLRLTFISLNMVKSIFAAIFSAFFVNTVSRAIFHKFSTLLLITLFIIYLLFYAILLIVMRFLEEEDIEMLKAIERKTGVRIEVLRNFVRKFI